MSAREANPVVRAVFRLPRSAYLPVVVLGMGVTVLVTSWAWALVYLVPLSAAAFVARRATVIDQQTITVRALFGRAGVAWNEVHGLLVDERGHVSVALADRSTLLLPFVRLRHLSVLSQLSGGRVPAIPAPTEPKDTGDTAPSAAAPTDPGVDADPAAAAAPVDQ